MNHKCNKCYQQALVRTENGNKEFCLSLDYEIKYMVHNCTEFIDDLIIQEPGGLEERVINLKSFFKSNPSDKRIEERLTDLRNNVILLRAWARKKHKPKIRK